MSDAVIAAETHDTIGEGPVHDPREGTLRWVDIVTARWHRLDLATGTVTTTTFETGLTAFAPSEAGGWIGAFVDGIASIASDGTRGAFLARPEAGVASNRFNDGGADPHGRFLAGTMNMVDSAPTGALYGFDGANLSTLRNGIGITNTVAFSPDGTVFYTADSATGSFGAFAYDAETGHLGDPVQGFRVDPDLPGAPDGSSVDAEGYVWNARWDGACLVRLAPDGSTDRIVRLPVSRPTSCAFVGTDLYVTTATFGYDAARKAAEPLAGCLLRIDAGVASAPLRRFRPHT